MHHSIIFFDGMCGLCNKLVNLLVLLDTKNTFKYAPLQGKTAQRLLPHEVYSKLDTIVYYENNQYWFKSHAILKILSSLGGIFYFFSLFGTIVPIFICDFFYTLVSKNRYQWFGRTDSCRVPLPEERDKFLD